IKELHEIINRRTGLSVERISIGKLRYVEPVIYQSREDARKASLSGEFIVYALGLTEQAYRRLESFCIKNNLVEVYKMDILEDPHDIFNELRTKEFMLRERSTNGREGEFRVYSCNVYDSQILGNDRSKRYRSGNPKCPTPTIEQLYFKLIKESGSVIKMAYSI
ncbi:TPA: hypothetical protein ACUB6Y_006345, partial [Raoultella ornithinolytica]|nr:hypothetical protein [Escherichia coli]HDI2407440.1 hypothetical protein [Klebsiella pneumoniae]HDS5562913.1 hypothetical protein [Klebsiella michiganensis]HDI2758584.1 hypothetical protein [Klebsiella pneumoniae]HDI2769663.1 hypothetical protein [Klebsiella pneumoniae]